MRPIDADALYERAYRLNLDYIVSDVELRMVKTLLDHAPTIEGWKKGKWIDIGDYCVCNQCGHTEQQFNGVEPIPLHAPFCAMCGADMRDENDNIPMEYFENGGK